MRKSISDAERLICWDGNFKTLHLIIPIKNAVEPSDFNKKTGNLTIKTDDEDILIKVGDWIHRDEFGNCKKEKIYFVDDKFISN